MVPNSHWLAITKVLFILSLLSLHVQPFNILILFHFLWQIIPKRQQLLMQVHNNHYFFNSRAQNKTETIKWDEGSSFWGRSKFWSNFWRLNTIYFYYLFKLTYNYFTDSLRVRLIQLILSYLIWFYLILSYETVYYVCLTSYIILSIWYDIILS